MVSGIAGSIVCCATSLPSTLSSNRDLDAVERSNLVWRAGKGALRAVAVVTSDVDDQRLVELAHPIDLVDHASDLVVGVGKVCCEHIRLADEQLLFVGAELVPILQ